MPRCVPDAAEPRSPRTSRSFPESRRRRAPSESHGRIPPLGREDAEALLLQDELDLAEELVGLAGGEREVGGLRLLEQKPRACGRGRPGNSPSNWVLRRVDTAALDGEGVAGEGPRCRRHRQAGQAGRSIADGNSRSRRVGGGAVTPAVRSSRPGPQARSGGRPSAASWRRAPPASRSTAAGGESFLASPSGADLAVAREQAAQPRDMEIRRRIAAPARPRPCSRAGASCGTPRRFEQIKSLLMLLKQKLVVAEDSFCFNLHRSCFAKFREGFCKVLLKFLCVALRIFAL